MTKSIVSIQKKEERCNEKKKSQKNKIDGKENISPYRKFFISMYIAHTHTHIPHFIEFLPSSYFKLPSAALLFKSVHMKKMRRRRKIGFSMFIFRRRRAHAS